MYKHLLLIAALLSCVAGAASADILYDVTVNTKSIVGTNGSLDFQFNPGPFVSQSADLQISNFMSDGTLTGSPTLTPPPPTPPQVSGALPGTVTFVNGINTSGVEISAFNDYFQGFTFGSNLSFDVLLGGPAVNSPNGTATSGSTFAFSMFSDAAGTMPVLTSDKVNGFAFTIDVNLDGSTTVANSSAQTTVTLVTTPSVPEPGTLSLMASGIGLWLAFSSRLRRR
jgi:hypothetical protein